MKNIIPYMSQISLKTNSTKRVYGCIAMGKNATASGEGSLVIGNDSTCYGKNSVVIGNSMTCHEDNVIYFQGFPSLVDLIEPCLIKQFNTTHGLEIKSATELIQYIFEEYIEPAEYYTNTQKMIVEKFVDTYCSV